MTQTPDELVTEFCKKWSSPDAADLAAYFTEDGVYHNVQLDPVTGPAAIEEYIAGFTAPLNGIDFQVHRQVSDGNIVMNERTDIMRRTDGEEVALPVMGVFEVVDGKIAKWSDYFDMAIAAKAYS
jgi:limonene-1,2-epoxide hydrolase